VRDFLFSSSRSSEGGKERKMNEDCAYTHQLPASRRKAR
jgi:hypothetical protein